MVEQLLKRLPSSAEQALSILGHALSGSAAFLGHSLLSSLLTCSLVMVKGRGIEMSVVVGRGG